jgi:hypothetical protein
MNPIEVIMTAHGSNQNEIHAYVLRSSGRWSYCKYEGSSSEWTSPPKHIYAITDRIRKFIEENRIVEISPDEFARAERTLGTRAYVQIKDERIKNCFKRVFDEIDTIPRGVSAPGSENPLPAPIVLQK